MTTISRSALLPYPPAAIFALVNDIESYPEFLPGCRGATVHRADENEIEATLELGKAGLRYSFTTRNELQPPHLMRMNLIDGPFRSFSAEWRFEPLGENACKASLELDFEFRAGLLDAALGTLFESTAKEMVSAISARAEKLYGKS